MLLTIEHYCILIDFFPFFISHFSSIVYFLIVEHLSVFYRRLFFRQPITLNLYCPHHVLPSVSQRVYNHVYVSVRLSPPRIHVQGNARLKAGGSHPDSRAIMFEEGKYSRRRIMDLLSALSGLRQAAAMIRSLTGEATAVPYLRNFRALRC